jgi:plasmid maintenance system antidote protein VapI
MSARPRSDMFSPGSYLRDELHDRGWSVAEFAQRAGMTVEQVKAIVSATIPVTPRLADAIARAFGTDSELWLSLERNFGRWKSSIARGGDVRAV